MSFVSDDVWRKDVYGSRLLFAGCAALSLHPELQAWTFTEHPRSRGALSADCGETLRVQGF